MDRRVRVRSAGTHTSQPGARPDQRARKLARAAGISIDRIRARRITEKALISSDFIVAMDSSNLRELLELCPVDHQHKISLLLSHLPGEGLTDVPDPYYGGIQGFQNTFDIVERSCRGLLKALENGELKI